MPPPQIGLGRWGCGVLFKSCHLQLSLLTNALPTVAVGALRAICSSPGGWVEIPGITEKKICRVVLVEGACLELTTDQGLRSSYGG